MDWLVVGSIALLTCLFGLVFYGLSELGYFE